MFIYLFVFILSLIKIIFLYKEKDIYQMILQAS